ncbi:NAD(P)/FAD-dependent oxidoreductase [Sediminibacterium ginsengisoli]|uniref:NADH:ubiquinone reductase (non-electrogenic) n=1 Tax=Sediminibacterium ginsengisoli TaxID=413434 RepID=A0A1T4PKK7_9BACT|nr:NAD(P)/FAD-dependent oxidoreductase [Sediminibacterium ginsengisoli]SJZ91999.1 NADH dehydrogenase [Sediminibacterium ginsengisoli]
MAKKQIVILGAGFAGLQVARHIVHTDYEITLIDQYNFHQFQPLFYQVATARLEPSSISFPLRKVFQKKRNVHVRIACVESVDVQQKRVITNEGDFSYDYLVIATGCTTNYFGNKNIEKYAYPMKSTTEAITLRNRILLNFEDALSASADELEAIMNIVVVGGGPTGVELSGSFAEMKKNVLPKDYPDMDFSRLNVYLLEAGPATLGPMSKASQEKSKEYLEKMGVKVWTGAQVKDYDGKTVMLADGRTILTHNLIWAAGVTGNVPPGIPQSALVRGNRIKVDHYNRVEGIEDVFAIGDIAYMETPDFPKGHAQLANVAIAQAKNTASNFSRLQKGGEMKIFKYKNPGTMATVGKRKAVVDLPFMSFQGRLAWFVWMFLHLMLIVSVKNRLIIFINWAISYFTNDTTLRLILLPTRKQVELAEQHQKEQPANAG